MRDLREDPVRNPRKAPGGHRPAEPARTAHGHGGRRRATCRC